MFAYRFNKTLYSDKVFRRIELIKLARQTSALEKNAYSSEVGNFGREPTFYRSCARCVVFHVFNLKISKFSTIKQKELTFCQRNRFEFYVFLFIWFHRSSRCGADLLTNDR